MRMGKDGRLSALAWVPLLALSLASGRSWAAPSQGAGPGISPAQPAQRSVKAPGAAKVGDRTTCPVHTDQVFRVSDKTPKAEYKGRVYYFCCPHCRDHFLEAPEKYVR